MAQVVSGNQVKLSNGQIVNAQQGGWYDGQQFWGGTLSNPGQINSQSNQVGAGQQVSKEVIAQTNPNNVQYIQQQQQKQQQVQPQAPVSSYGNMSMADASSSNGMSSSAAALSVDSTPTLNLPDLYKGLYDKSGISDLEKQLSDSVTRYNDAQAAINDDPFLSEAKRVGRIQKLSTDFDNRVANLKNDIATKKADIETQIQLQTKQFDINSQAAQQNFAKFQTLLQMGALDNASGEDIANITRATGISSSLIYSAVQANKAKNVKTQVIPFDDGVNQGFAVINADTGEVIKQQIVAASKQTITGDGSGGTSLLNQSRQLDLEKAQAPQVLLAGAKMGKTLDDMIQFGSQFGLSPQEIFNIYMSVDYYHNTPDQIKAAKKKYGIK